MYLLTRNVNIIYLLIYFLVLYNVKNKSTILFAFKINFFYNVFKDFCLYNIFVLALAVEHVHSLIIYMVQECEWQKIIVQGNEFSSKEE